MGAGCHMEFHGVPDILHRLSSSLVLVGRQGE